MEYFDVNNILSHTFLQNIKHRPKVVQDLLKKLIEHLKKDIGEQCLTSSTPNTMHHWQEW